MLIVREPYLEHCVCVYGSMCIRVCVCVDMYTYSVYVDLCTCIYTSMYICMGM